MLSVDLTACFYSEVSIVYTSPYDLAHANVKRCITSGNSELSLKPTKIHQLLQKSIRHFTSSSSSGAQCGTHASPGGNLIFKRGIEPNWRCLGPNFQFFGDFFFILVNFCRNEVHFLNHKINLSRHIGNHNFRGDYVRFGQKMLGSTDRITSTKMHWIGTSASQNCLLDGDNWVQECTPLNWKVGCSIHGHWVNHRSTAWARAFTPNCPGKKQISDLGLPPIADTKKIVSSTLTSRTCAPPIAPDKQ